MDTTSLFAFTRAYIDAMLWSSTVGPDDEPADRNYSVADLAPEALERITKDCKEFYEAHSALFTEENRTYNDGIDPVEAAGHDFWLTRNGHGAGFYDGDWDGPTTLDLVLATDKYPELNLFVGDDGKLHF